MISIDTNILLPAVEAKNADHVKAAAFLESLTARDDVAISEMALVELYVLLRNPAVLGQPLTPSDAVRLCEEFRRHPAWQIIGFPGNSRAFHDAYGPGSPRRALLAGGPTTIVSPSPSSAKASATLPPSTSWTSRALAFAECGIPSKPNRGDP